MTGTGRSDHRGKKNREFDRKPRRANKIDLTPFTFLHPSRLIDLRIIKTGNRQQQQQEELVPDICQTRERLNSTRRQRSYIPWYSFRYRDAKEEMEEDDHVEKIRSGLSVARPASIGSMANADIEGDMFWNTPLSSVLMSRFLWAYLGDRFFPRACQEGIYVSCYHGVLFAAQTVPTGRNFDRWKPETSMNSCFFFFFFRFSIPIRAIFDRFSIGPPSTFNTVIF